MKVKPLNDRILVTRLEEKKGVTGGGIIIPDTAKEKPMEGKVIAVGIGRRLRGGKRVPLEVKVGDRIVFAKYAGTEVKINDKEHVIIKEDDVLGIIV
jgi:chaperonin GroES